MLIKLTLKRKTGPVIRILVKKNVIINLMKVPVVETEPQSHPVRQHP